MYNYYIHPLYTERATLGVQLLRCFAVISLSKQAQGQRNPKPHFVTLFVSCNYYVYDVHIILFIYTT